MKRPLITIIAIILGIVVTNAIVSTKKAITEQSVEDSVGTGQAAPTEVSGDIPL